MEVAVAIKVQGAEDAGQVLQRRLTQTERDRTRLSRLHSGSRRWIATGGSSGIVFAHDLFAVYTFVKKETRQRQVYRLFSLNLFRNGAQCKNVMLPGSARRRRPSPFLAIRCRSRGLVTIQNGQSAFEIFALAREVLSGVQFPCQCILRLAR